MERALAERVWVARLLDTYGELLTDHQQTLLRLYYLDDLSLGEIAERLRVTRQAVFDGLRRSVRELERFEASVGLVAVADRMSRRQAEVHARLAALEDAIAQLQGRVDEAVLRGITRALGGLRRALRS
ncbi:MAG: sigma factor-like helix-turn-helix DNA-binding protein [Armatimonadota bacterium]|nr:sigma factor-like helix-turn-helix DNA-binding protein [Armatimonadota bacterium]